MAPCPCLSGLDHDDCCGPVLRGDRPAATAEELMRSRYTAFAMGEIDYLGSSHHPSTRDQFDAGQAREWSSRSEWKGFEVLESEGGGPGDEAGTVEFVARYAIDGEDFDHHEVAEFERKEGRWYFRDGHQVGATVRREGPKIGRNDPCPCGSGKKHKRCCMAV
jgi:SEC-C motif-containing protein